MSAVTYEVTLWVQRAIAADYRAWLDQHVRAMLALPGFTGARVSEVHDPAPGENEVAFCCQYRLRDAAALDDYLREHAPAMRADGQARFGGRFRAERRILHDLANL